MIGRLSICLEPSLLWLEGFGFAACVACVVGCGRILAPLKATKA